MKYQKDRILILRVSKYSDSHLIVTGLTPQGARISLLAPAALKSRKRFGGGVLEPTHFIEINYEKASSDDKLHILKEAQLIESFEKLRDDYDRLNLAFYFLKIIDKTHLEEVQDSENTFALLGHALRALSVSKDLKSLKAHFEIKFLYTQGVLEPNPSLEHCLKMRFQDSVSFSDEFLDSNLYQKINLSLKEYMGFSN